VPRPAGAGLPGSVHPVRTTPSTAPGGPFGRALTAMVTSFTPDGALDLGTAQKRAYQCDAEKSELAGAVAAEVLA